MKNVLIKKIINELELTNAIRFIHDNDFSLESSTKKISKNFDGRVLGLTLNTTENDIVGSIFYYYQPIVKINNTKYKVINFSTIYIKKEYRGKGLLTLLLRKTKEIFIDYIITDYTPIPKVRHLLLKMGFDYMKNYRSLVLPLPNPKCLIDFKVGKLKKIDDIKTYEDVFKTLEDYRKYEISLWKYQKNNIDILLGTTFKNHQRNFSLLKIKTSSVRVLWTDDEEKLLAEANNIAFLFFLKLRKSFVTIDCEKHNRPIFSLKLNNQFMVFPKQNVRIPPTGSEFFSGII